MRSDAWLLKGVCTAVPAEPLISGLSQIVPL